MKTIHSKVPLLFVVSLSVVAGCKAVDQSKEGEVVTLEPYAHEFNWVPFTVSKDAPVSADGRYRLQKVAKDGSVELVFSDTPTESQVIVAKPPPKKFEKGNSLPTVVVVEADPKAQTATLNELRMQAPKRQDGLSFAMAVKLEAKTQAEGVAAQHAWIEKNLPGARPAPPPKANPDKEIVTFGQEMIQHDGKLYSVVHLEMPDEKPRDVYFDITGYFGK